MRSGVEEIAHKSVQAEAGEVSIRFQRRKVNVKHKDSNSSTMKRSFETQYPFKGRPLVVPRHDCEQDFSGAAIDWYP